MLVTLAAPGVASAQSSVPDVTNPAALQQLRDQVTNGILDARDAVHANTAGLPPEIRTQINTGVDNTVNFLAPGAIAAREAARQPAPRPAPPASNPCPATARACVDLRNQTTWLQDNGRVTFGPVGMSSGGPGKETPRGNFRVVRKVRDEVSHEFNDAPMPFAVYFTNQGHAFHQGSTSTRSAGCVRLPRDAAQRYFGDLNVGDQVSIF